MWKKGQDTSCGPFCPPQKSVAFLEINLLSLLASALPGVNLHIWEMGLTGLIGSTAGALLPRVCARPVTWCPRAFQSVHVVSTCLPRTAQGQLPVQTQPVTGARVASDCLYRTYDLHTSRHVTSRHVSVFTNSRETRVGLPCRRSRGHPVVSQPLTRGPGARDLLAPPAVGPRPAFRPTAIPRSLLKLLDCSLANLKH